MNVAVVKLQSLAALQEREVVRDALAVLEKEVFDGISAITEAQDELLVSEVSIVLHEVPENRPVADGHHWLRHTFGVIPEAGAKAPAEEDDLHCLFLPPGAPGCQLDFTRGRMRISVTSAVRGRRREAAAGPGMTAVAQAPLFYTKNPPRIFPGL